MTPALPYASPQAMFWKPEAAQTRPTYVLKLPEASLGATGLEWPLDRAVQMVYTIYRLQIVDFLDRHRVSGAPITELIEEVLTVAANINGPVHSALARNALVAEMDQSTRAILQYIDDNPRMVLNLFGPLPRCEVVSTVGGTIISWR